MVDKNALHVDDLIDWVEIETFPGFYIELCSSCDGAGIVQTVIETMDDCGAILEGDVHTDDHHTFKFIVAGGFHYQDLPYYVQELTTGLKDHGDLLYEADEVKKAVIGVVDGVRYPKFFMGI